MILAMSLHPEVQARAQADLDRIVGDRLPTIEDMSSLPYIMAIVKETLRWSPPATVGEFILRPLVYVMMSDALG